MLTVAEAMQRIIDTVPAGGSETIATPDAADRILGELLRVPHDSPPFDKSMMDGFAVDSTAFSTRTGDQHEIPVIETVIAGQVPCQHLNGAMAIRIMTGAMMPGGADCVVPIEQTRFDETRPAQVGVDVASIRPGANLLKKGSVATAGRTLLPEGTRLRAQHLAALAEFGIAQLTVRAQPRIAVLATGDELLAPDAPLEPGRIRNSNELMLAALVKQADGVPVRLGIARDNIDDIDSHLHQGLQQDFLLITGGVSAGTHDLIPARLAAAGVERVFHGVQMKPGKPLWFGIRPPSSGANSGKPCVVFGLPGNPVSSLVCFELFVRTAIARFVQSAQAAPQASPGTLTASVSVRGNRPTYHPCELTRTDTELQVRPVEWSGSSDLRATTEANGMCLLEPDRGDYAAGTRVCVWPWGRSAD